eukprot:6433553-Pyramimonas_sp.AAC.1
MGLRNAALGGGTACGHPKEGEGGKEGGTRGLSLQNEDPTPQNGCSVMASTTLARVHVLVCSCACCARAGEHPPASARVGGPPARASAPAYGHVRTGAVVRAA